MIYLIGSLRNDKVPNLANDLRTQGYDVFDDWHAPGPETDDFWMKYEKMRGRSYADALNSPHAWNVFRFDKLHLDKADTVVLVMPAGKSGHLEFGYSIGMGKCGIVFFDGEPERWDVMYRFATGLCFTRGQLNSVLERTEEKKEEINGDDWD